MNRFSKQIQIVLALVTMAALTGCGLGQATQPTPTAVDVNAVMTSAAATAFVQLTQIAGQASPTSAPTQTQAATPTTEAPTQAPAGSTPAGALEATITVTPTLAATAAVVGGLTVTAVPSLTPIGAATASGANSGPACLNSKYIADITIPDGTVLKPYEKFYKVWRIQNTGFCPWDQGYGLTIWAGPSMGASAIYFSNGDQKVGAGGTVDLGVEMRAPAEPGDYVAHWSMIDDQGKIFGGDFTVFIKVVK